MRPTVFLGYTSDDGSPWSARDRELAKALVLHDADLCTGCGHSLAETTALDEHGDPKMSGWYDAVPVTCAACAALDEARKDDDKPAPGTRWRIARSPAYAG